MRQGNLLDRIESRILIGVASYIGIMILIGWVAINENARMDSFERQYQARSIERGAALYAANCSSCHGAEGLGIGGYAPALNNPQYFGYDILGQFDLQMDAVGQEGVALSAENAALVEEITELEEQSSALNSESETYEEDAATIEARLEEITVRQEEITFALSDSEVGVGARFESFRNAKDNAFAQLQGTGYPFYVALDDAGAETTDHYFSRLNQLNWNGTMYDFTFTTLVHGRPPSISYWGGNQMVAWSQTAGGPLRDDQLGDLTEYILNWDKGRDWTLDDFLAVNQYAIEPSPPGAGGEPVAPLVGSDVVAILAQLETEGIVGDAARGEQIYLGAEATERGAVMACVGCHQGGVNAPDTIGTWDRVLNDRLTLAQFEGYTVEQYVIESIVRAGDFVVEEFQAVVMPGDLGIKLSLQDVADLLVYLESAE
jgi:cytochrome c553